MLNELNERDNKLREFFGLQPESKLLAEDSAVPDLTPKITAHLAHYNIEWYSIPAKEIVPIDENYLKQLYPQRAVNFSASSLNHGAGLNASLTAAHGRHQGKIIGVERTIKPDYLPGNRQFYGTENGFEPAADPFAEYLGNAGFTSGTRFAHNYASLQKLGEIINADWRARSLMPAGYRLTVCPPLIFNLIGNVFHPEWSKTKALELAAYRDDSGNAICYAVGSNSANDFSYIQKVDVDSDWTLLGFRAALIPDRKLSI